MLFERSTALFVPVGAAPVFVVFTIYEVAKLGAGFASFFVSGSFYGDVFGYTNING
jgi:hypothetical protein